MLSHLCTDYLEPLRRAHGPVVIISGYRTKSWNARVGGARRSFHVYVPERQGVAADVVAARGEPADWWRTLLKLRPGGLGKYPGHVHVDNRAGLARW